jgi:D-alanyl-D-alanine carboxypeptidase/D-alanyl-D-alanine-endopeptidase (penicillin-binding protein 4)
MLLLGLVSQASLASDLSSRLNKVISKHSIAKENLGLAVLDLEKADKPLLFGLHDEREMTPASITKITTAATVLQKIGASTKLQTTLWSAAPIKDGVLKGDLVLKGGGDSGFVSETMWFLVNEFMRTGVKKIEGNILVDDTDFDGVRADESRDPERVDRAYDAPVGAMSFNWNSISIFIRPKETGTPPQVYLDPIDNGYKVENKAKTVAGTGNNLEVSRDGGTITVRGSIGANQPEAAVYKNIDDPVDWSGRNFVFSLVREALQSRARCRQGKRPTI